MKNEFIKKLEALKIRKAGQNGYSKGMTTKGQWNEAIDTCRRLFLESFGNSEVEIDQELDRKAVIYLKTMNELNEVSHCWKVPVDN